MLDESTAIKADVRFAPTTVIDKEPKGQVVQQFIGKDHPRQRSFREVRDRFDAAWMQRALLL